MRSQSIMVRHVRMRWEESGEGFPVVLVHGFPTSPALWRRVVPLVRDARCLAWEMVGYGESIPQGADRDIGVRQQARYLSAWLDELGIERAILAGHDVGGSVVQAFSVREPQRCAGLLLVASAAYGGWVAPAMRGLQALRGVVARMPDDAFKPLFASIIRRGHDDAETARESLSLHWRPYAEHEAAEAFARQLRSLRPAETRHLADEVPRLRVPARVLWGAADEMHRLSDGDRLAWDLGAPLERVEGARQFVPEDHPGRVARALDDLLVEARMGAPGLRGAGRARPQDAFG